MVEVKGQTRSWLIIAPNPLPNLSGKHILISAGSHDPKGPSHYTKELFDLLRKFGAKVSIQRQSGGHELTQRDIMVAKEWISSL